MMKKLRTMIHNNIQYVQNNIVSKYLFTQQLITRHTLPSVFFSLSQAQIYSLKSYIKPELHYIHTV